MNKTNKIIYYISTSLLTLLMLFSAGMYFFNHDLISDTFTFLGYPTYLIYPLAILKLLGLLAIWTNKFPVLSEWAYAGFFFDFVLALSAHIDKQDGAHAFAIIAIILLITSRIYNPHKRHAL